MTKGPGLKPIRPEYLAAVLSELADNDALFFADTGTPVIWAARHISYGPNRRLFGSFTWASMASAAPNAFGAQLAFPGRQTIALCGDGGFTMLGLGDLLTQVQRKAPVVSIIFNNSMLDFVNIEQQEAGFVLFGTEFTNPDFGKVAEAMGAKGIRIEEPGDVRDGLRGRARPQGRARRGRRPRRPLRAVAARPTCPRRQRPRASPSAWPSKRCTGKELTGVTAVSLTRGQRTGRASRAPRLWPPIVPTSRAIAPGWLVDHSICRLPFSPCGPVRLSFAVSSNDALFHVAVPETFRLGTKRADLKRSTSGP